jgi:hypothetical protein
MKKMIMVALTLGILATATLGLAFAYDGESSAAAKVDVCDSLSDLSSTVMSYQGLNPATATTDELESAADDIDDAWDEVEDEAYDWVYADDNALTQAYYDLDDAIEELPCDYTIAQSLEALEPELSAFPQAYRDTFDLSGCTSA